MKQLEIPANTEDFRTRVYAGASMGSSHLNPDTTGTRFTVDSSNDTGTQLRLGFDVHNMLAVELDTSVLGTSDLREAGTDVKYSAAAISALVYGVSGVQMRSRREGFSAYGRLGMAALKKSSAVVPLEESGTAPILGLGAEYGFDNGLGVRAEITRFDEDATFLGIGAVYRFGLSPQGIGRMIADAAEPALRSSNTQVAAQGRVLSGQNSAGSIRQAGSRTGLRAGGRAAASAPQLGAAMPTSSGNRQAPSRWQVKVSKQDTDADGVRNGDDLCPNTDAYVSVNRIGCGLFDAVLNDVTFKSGSWWLTPRARGQLDGLADTLLAFPEARIKVRAHTDSQGPADINLALSTRRAEAVVHYLQSRGINELQLIAEGHGEAQPIDSNKDEIGRRRNRRVDVITLAELGTEAMQANTRTAQHLSAEVKADEWTYGISANGPALGAATPANGSAASTSAVATTEEAVFPATREQMLTPLPEPGYAPGLSDQGVIEGLTFAPGSAELSPSAMASLSAIRVELKRHTGVRIAVMAHTDDQGAAEDNKQLSEQRAQAVVEYLVQAGVASDRLVAEGYGELLPLVQNVTEEDRTRNRRVEIRVLR